MNSPSICMLYITTFSSFYQKRIEKMYLVMLKSSLLYEKICLNIWR